MNFDWPDAIVAVAVVILTILGILTGARYKKKNKPKPLPLPSDKKKLADMINKLMKKKK